MRRLILLSAVAAFACSGEPETPQTTEDVEPQTAPPIVDACDPVEQTGCSADELCATIVTTATAGAGCVADDGRAGAVGEACGRSSCAAGSLCLDADGTGFSCWKLCDPNTKRGCEMVADTSCWQRVLQTNWAICRAAPETCDLLDQGACAAGTSCQLFRVPGASMSEPRCLPSGDGRSDAVCEGSGQCGRGFLCVGFDGDKRCHQLCDASTSCESGTCVGALTGRTERVCR